MNVHELRFKSGLSKKYLKRYVESITDYNVVQADLNQPVNLYVSETDFFMAWELPLANITYTFNGFNFDNIFHAPKKTVLSFSDFRQQIQTL